MTMFQVRFHGRGGQGVVTAAELLADAAFREGRRTGGPGGDVQPGRSGLSALP
jgi:hypothetical protein